MPLVAEIDAIDPSVVHPGLVVRDTLPEDVEVLHRIRSHPLVVPHQYPLRASDAPQAWRQRLFPERGPRSRYCKTIEVDGVTVAYISYGLIRVGGRTFCLVGWDLHPDHWGRGLMTMALRQTLPELQRKHGVGRFLAFCFAENQRCQGLLRRSGFTERRVGLLIHLQMALHHRTWRWLRCFGKECG